MSKNRKQGYEAGEDDELAFLDAVGPSRSSQTGYGDDRAVPPLAPGRRRRKRQKTGRRSSPVHVQVSAWVHKDVRTGFDVAQAQEGAERGRRRDFSEVVESLMDFYAREGDPWEVLRDRR